MIIPVNNGKTITPIYIPQPVTTYYNTLQQSDNAQSSEPTLVTWVVLGVVLIFCIAVIVYFIKFLKYIFGGEE